jgi:hypothetical protein
VTLFGEHVIDVPDLAPVTRTAILGFLSTGQDPLNWWQRLHAIGERTAYRPLLTDSDLAESLDRHLARDRHGTGERATLTMARSP